MKRTPLILQSAKIYTHSSFEDDDDDDDVQWFNVHLKAD